MKMSYNLFTFEYRFGYAPKIGVITGVFRICWF